MALIIVVAALGAVALYYCRKSKEIEQRLEYEMSDARSLAQVRTVVNVSEQHGRLGTQSEE